MLLFFTFGTATLAHELEPVGPLAQLDLRDCLKRHPVQIDPQDVTVGLPFETYHVSRSSSSDLAARRAGGPKLVQPLRARIPANARAGKVSVRFYDSVLLL